MSAGSIRDFLRRLAADIFSIDSPYYRRSGNRASAHLQVLTFMLSAEGVVAYAYLTRQPETVNSSSQKVNKYRYFHIRLNQTGSKV